MAYSKKELVERSLELIKKYKLYTHDAVVGLLGISKETYYKYKLNQDVAIRESMWRQKETLKAALRKKWFESDNATVQVALYKLLGTEDECHRLNGSKQQHDITSGGIPLAPVIKFSQPKRTETDAPEPKRTRPPKIL